MKKGQITTGDILYEDTVRAEKKFDNLFLNQYSPGCDFIYYRSSLQPELHLAMRVLKPIKKSYILVKLHGWHMSCPEFEHLECAREDYLIIQPDMRGRAFSEGQPDCNGWELYDVIDAVNYARKHYAKYILDEKVVYLEGGSGGGGNAMSIVGKFPDFFAAATANFGPSDYSRWYQKDLIGEFRDEMSIWIKPNPEEYPMAYKSRSGLFLLENLISPLFMAHGVTDERVPIEQLRVYIERAIELNKMNLIQATELEGVGTRDHLGNATIQQIELIRKMGEENRLLHRVSLEIPDQGTLVIAGYLFTKKFSIVLEDIDAMATVEYDLDKNSFIVSSEIEGIKYSLEKYV